MPAINKPAVRWPTPLASRPLLVLAACLVVASYAPLAEPTQRAWQVVAGADTAGAERARGSEAPWWSPEAPGSQFVRHEGAQHVLVTDVPAAEAAFILDALALNLDWYRHVLNGALQIPELREEDARYLVRVFADVRAFQRYHVDRWHEAPGRRGFAYHHTANTAAREFVAFRSPVGEFLASLRHEGFHQVLRSVIAYPPQWLNEGIAEYLEPLPPEVPASAETPAPAPPTGSPDDSAGRDSTASAPAATTSFPQHVGWARQLREYIGEGRRYEPVDVATLTQMPKDEWLANSGATYATSWALVWLLRHQIDGGQKILRDYLRALSPDADRPANTQAGWDATFGALTPEERAAIDDAVAAFAVSVSPTPAYDTFLRATELVSRRSFEAAGRLLDEVIEADAAAAHGRHAAHGSGGGGFYAAYFYRGLTRRAAAESVLALDDLLRARALFPQYTSALRLAITVAVDLDDLATARTLFRELSAFDRNEERVDRYRAAVESLLPSEGPAVDLLAPDYDPSPRIVASDGWAARLATNDPHPEADADGQTDE